VNERDCNIAAAEDKELAFNPFQSLESYNLIELVN
jgi:hypothetical protein